MKVGVNLTSSVHLKIVSELVRSGHADFYELLLDNFIHLDPGTVREALGDVPVAFHLMNTRFMEREFSELRWIGERVRLFSRELSPLYVSDHVARFSVEGRLLPMLAECEYGRNQSAMLQRISSWQDLLGQKVHLENFPSILDAGNEQVDFFAEIQTSTGAGTLFDVSNACVAQLNCGLSSSLWAPVSIATEHYHVGGFRASRQGDGLFVDSHDCAVSGESLSLVRALTRSGPRSTIVVERDANISVEEWATDLSLVRGLYA